jgi:heme A synthase
MKRLVALVIIGVLYGVIGMRVVTELFPFGRPQPLDVRIAGLYLILACFLLLPIVFTKKIRDWFK